MRSPGFEPGSSAWEADVLTKLDYDRSFRPNHVFVGFILPTVTLSVTVMESPVLDKFCLV